MTLPPSDEENYDHKLLTLWPVFGGLFIFWQLNGIIADNKIILFIFIGFMILL